MALRVHTYVLLMYNCVSWVAVAVAGWGSHICIYLMQQTDCWNCQKLNFSSYFIQAHSSTPQLLTHLRPKCTPSEWVTRQSVKLKLAGTFYCAQIYSQIHSFFFFVHFCSLPNFSQLLCIFAIWLISFFDVRSAYITCAKFHSTRAEQSRAEQSVGVKRWSRTKDFGWQLFACLAFGIRLFVALSKVALASHKPVALYTLSYIYIYRVLCCSWHFCTPLLF